ncbi:PucR family transcriptional regulator [Lentzea sp. NPDC051213]|uniref:PucR family transcriptional regulator n=1 Tax=Lentzea sp. NPDC051213 TaxID=3364126 RepID=UPI0037961554
MTTLDHSSRAPFALVGTPIGRLADEEITAVTAPVPPEAGAGTAYLILVVRGSTTALADQVSEYFGRYNIPGTLHAPGDTGAVVLVPDGDELRTRWLVDEFREWLGERAWCATARRTRAEIQSGYQEAADVLDLVLAAGRGPGVYDMDDVLVEYAVTQNDAVSSSLVAIVASLMASSSVSFETLDALIRADYSRTQTAAELCIHRSTLDYRLRRIEELTGYDPVSGRGVRVLGAAMTAYALSTIG